MARRTKQLPSRPHGETHLVHRIGWLRAAVLGANDGIVSTASLIVGVAAAATSREGVIVGGIAALVAGAMSMAAGEYVSVSSQADTEKADLKRERRELKDQPAAELHELAVIYEKRGLDRETARAVARQLMEHDALAAHARDELGISETGRAQPVQAALASAAAFATGAALPLTVALMAPLESLIAWVAAATLLALAILGVTSARAGGAKIGLATARIVFWGALAMAVTAGIGTLVGSAV